MDALARRREQVVRRHMEVENELDFDAARVLRFGHDPPPARVVDVAQVIAFSLRNLSITHAPTVPDCYPVMLPVQDGPPCAESPSLSSASSPS